MNWFLPSGKEDFVPPENANYQLKDQALALAQEGELAQAEPLLRAYTDRYPYDVEALAWLAACVAPAEAIGLLDRVLELDPEAHYAHAWRACCAYQITPHAATTDASAETSPVPVTKAEEAEVVEFAASPDESGPTDLAPSPSPDEAPTVPRLNGEAPLAETVELASPVADPESENIENGPVSLTGLIPDFTPLPDTAVIIPPPPPPAPPQVEPLPLLDPNEWLPRATAEARRLPDLDQEATNEIFKLVNLFNSLPWLNPLKTPEGTFVEEADQRESYNRGIELARGWGGDYQKLNEAAQQFQKCRPPLGFAGAAETLVCASYVNERLYNPLGLVYAIFWADRALELDPFHRDALVARSEATVRSPWRLLADITLDRLRLLAPEHPRRYAIDGWHEYLTGNRRRADELLRMAVDTALTPAEKEISERLLNIVQLLSENTGG